MAAFTYRVATENDIALINEIYNENIDKLHGIRRTTEYWSEQLSCEERTYYVVAADAWFRIDIEDGQLWIGMLQVKPACQRKGIGRFVLTAAEELAKKGGYHTIGIHTTQDNTAARSLYASAGYKVTEIGPCTTADGIERVGYTFQKKLI